MAGSFGPTPRVLRLGYGFLSSLPYWDRAQPHVRALADSVDEASSIAVFDDPDVVYVLRVPSQRQQTVTLTIGTRLPAYPTSLGQVLLAGLPEAELKRYLERTPLQQLTPKTITDKDELRAVLERTREQGYSISNGRREPGVLSVAAPITNRRGEVIAALNVSTNPARISRQRAPGAVLPQPSPRQVDLRRSQVHLAPGRENGFGSQPNPCAQGCRRLSACLHGHADVLFCRSVPALP